MSFVQSSLSAHFQLLQLVTLALQPLQDALSSKIEAQRQHWMLLKQKTNGHSKPLYHDFVFLNIFICHLVQVFLLMVSQLLKIES